MALLEARDLHDSLLLVVHVPGREGEESFGLGLDPVHYGVSPRECDGQAESSLRSP
jgi:hypothetical protein